MSCLRCSHHLNLTWKTSVISFSFLRILYYFSHTL